MLFTLQEEVEQRRTEFERPVHVRGAAGPLLADAKCLLRPGDARATLPSPLLFRRVPRIDMSSVHRTLQPAILVAQLPQLIPLAHVQAEYFFVQS